LLTSITLGQYFPGKSFIHKLDPRTKIVVTMAFYAILLLFAAAAVVASQVPIRLIVRSLRPLWIIIAITVTIHIFMTPGRVVASLGPLTVTAEGVKQGSLMAARLIFLIIMSSLLTFTTSPIALTDGIERLLNPFRRLGLPAHELAMMMTIALRFIPTLIEETDRIMKAQMARGAEFGSGNLFKKAKSMIPLLVPLFISAFRRADELATAMEARCYRGGENRTRMKELKIQGLDMVAFLAISLLVLSLAWIRWGTGGATPWQIR